MESIRVHLTHIQLSLYLSSSRVIFEVANIAPVTVAAEFCKFQRKSYCILARVAGNGVTILSNPIMSRKVSWSQMYSVGLYQGGP
jgi:hypothetical protein